MDDIDLPASERVRVVRSPKLGQYRREALFAVLDAGIVCHVGFTFESAPMVIPTLYWRDDHHVYFHGSVGGRMLNAILGSEVCFTVTHLDGLVLTRSAFHHSANYRSALIIGRPDLIEDEARKTQQLKALMDTLFPGRWQTLRPVTKSELKATRVFALSIHEFSIKSRQGPPLEDERDLTWSAWGGMIPTAILKGKPIPDQTAAVNAFAEPDLNRFDL